MSRIGIIGGGPSGVFCALIIKYFNPLIDVVIFEKNEILKTLLYTGNGRCNISHKFTDIKEFASNYQRGEKFLYSVFNQFSPQDTIDFFKKLGIETYIQEDNRIFPKSNSAKEVRETLIKKLKKNNIVIMNSEAKNINNRNEKFFIDNEEFDNLVIACGTWSNIDFLKNIKLDFIEFKPSLCGAEIKEKEYCSLAGVSLKNVNAKIKFQKKSLELNDDMLFTHSGLSGPLIYKITSIFSRENYSNENPIKLYLNFIEKDFNLQKHLDNNSKKQIINIVNEFMPKSLAKQILLHNNINEGKRCFEIRKEERKLIFNSLTELEFNIIKPLKNGEIVHSGGIDLKQIEPKTMESKQIKNLYFCGEIVDIDGFCGGYNLQNCWSTAFVAGKNIVLSLEKNV